MWQGCTLVKEQNQFTVEAIRLEPTEGQILLWPSYLYHAVTTNNHDLPRISLAFNIIAMPKREMVDEPVNNDKVGLKKFNRNYI
jgi:ectoine hydroxylase-related dioxygenase (phytanoyl-CoA dioxygenase family)